MKKSILLLILTCIAGAGFSQSDYRKGYVITNARDTLRGLVNYQESAKMFKSCDFKASRDRETVSYDAQSIFGYGFENDKFYQSREIVLNNEPAETVFLEVVVKGLLSLYKFQSTYFVEKGTEGLQQLMNETREVVINDQRVMQNSNQHIGTMNRLVFDCVEMREKVQKITLNEKALTNFVEDYNRCKGETSATFKEEKPWTRFAGGFAVGLNNSQIEFDVVPGFEHLGGDFEIARSVMVGLTVDMFSPRLSERFSLHADFLYLNSSYHNYHIHDRAYSIERNDVTIDIKQFKIPIGARYTFPERKITPFINAGLSLTLHLSSGSKWVQEIESKSNPVFNTYEREALEITNRPLGFWGGLGVMGSISSKLNAFVEIRYEKAEGITKYTVDELDVDSKITNLQVFIGIRTK